MKKILMWNQYLKYINVKIAAITITQNDEFKFKEWVEHYKEYKDEVYLHIIIDNNSKQNYYDMIKKNFVKSVVIRRSTNGGCTMAYNDGIRLALKDNNVDSVMLIGNDIRLPKGNLTILHNYLFSDKMLGMTSPIVLKKDTNEIECYGCGLTRFSEMKPLCKGNRFQDVTQIEKYVSLLPGGMNLAKRELYETVGLQDENLFMYWDEVDIYIRSKKAGFLMGVTSRSVSWHQHINPNGLNVRPQYVGILIARNYIYLARKHYGKYKALYFAFYMFLLGTINIIRKINDRNVVHYFNGYYKGINRGLRMNMNNDFIPQ